MALVSTGQSLLKPQDVNLTDDYQVMFFEEVDIIDP